MARRKSTEVLITGDKVDARARIGSNPVAPGAIKKKPVGAFPEDNLERRPRKIPKVIDLAADPAVASKPGSSLAELEQELGMAPTASKAGPIGDSLSVPLQKRSKEENLRWEEIQRAKKLEFDLPPQPDPVAKPTSSDDIELSQPVARKPDVDLAPPLPPGTRKPDVDLAPPLPPTARKPDVDLAPPLPPTARKPDVDLAPPLPPTARRPDADLAPPQPPAARKPDADLAPPARANPAGRKAGPSSPQMQSKMIAETVVSSILERIKEEALKNGGQLSLANIDSLRNEFDAQTNALSRAFEQSFEAYILARERAAWYNKRDFPFDRLIVKKFSHLFSDKKAGFDRVSRRMLPGFFMAVGMMLGLDVVDETQERCRVIVERIRSQKGDAFDWSDVYESGEKEAVIMDALLPIALHFEDFEKRRDWFVELINGHLSVPTRDDKEDAKWEMTVPAFGRFFNALLADLRVELASENGKSRIVKRYGTDSANTAMKVLAKLP